VRLKNPLCKIDAYYCNLRHGCLLLFWRFQRSPAWHITMPSGGVIHAIRFTHSSVNWHLRWMALPVHRAFSGKPLDEKVYEGTHLRLDEPPLRMDGVYTLHFDGQIRDCIFNQPFGHGFRIEK